MRRRIFVIGLDGVGFPLIEPWIAAGKLPHLAQAVESGTHGTLESTIPPLTGPAWSSFQTGVNPGKHGVSSWTKRRRGRYAIRVVNGDDISYPTVWELASESGRKVVTIGLPLTYPPRPVNGVIIPGMLTPKSDPSPTYPPEAYAQLRRAAPDYRFFPECAQRFTLKGKVEELLTGVRGRAAAAKHFMRQYDWDLMMLHFQATDKVQHDLWGIQKDGFDPLLTVFQEVDRQVGELTEIAQGMGGSVILLSDHGMGPQEYTFSINTWLHESGYLKLKRGAAGRLKSAAFRLGFTQKRLMHVGLLLYPLAYRLGLVSSFFDTVGEGVVARLISSLFLSLDDIDWSRTLAYSHADIGHIRLNLQGREPQGIVAEEEADGLIDELIEELQAVVNPHNGEPLLGQVFRREEIYHGERLSQAPDILFLPRDLRTLGNGASGFYSKVPFDRPLLRANHRMEGILIATGEPFRSHHTIHGAALTDLPTNLLYLLGCPIPTYMDGMIWEEAFLPGTLMNEPPQWSERAPSRSGSSTDRQDSADDAELHRRLKQLGYLS
jgi:predicted AlkP superfamily phosphohydrolase/phosphomutase